MLFSVFQRESLRVGTRKPRILLRYNACNNLDNPPLKRPALFLSPEKIFIAK